MGEAWPCQSVMTVAGAQSMRKYWVMQTPLQVVFWSRVACV